MLALLVVPLVVPVTALLEALLVVLVGQDISSAGNTRSTSASSWY